MVRRKWFVLWSSGATVAVAGAFGMEAIDEALKWRCNHVVHFALSVECNAATPRDHAAFPNSHQRQYRASASRGLEERHVGRCTRTKSYDAETSDMLVIAAQTFHADQTPVAHYSGAKIPTFHDQLYRSRSACRHFSFGFEQNLKLQPSSRLKRRLCMIRVAF